MLTLPVFVCFVLAVSNGVLDFEPLHFPYAASLRVYGSNICGATMIKGDVLLTAAICVWHFRHRKDFSFLTVHAGTNVDYSDVGEIISVKQLHFIPNDPRLLYNVAVLRMNKEFTLGAPIKIRPSGASLPTNYWGALIGWKVTEVPGLPGRHYAVQKEEMRFIGSQDDWRNFQCETKGPNSFRQQRGNPVVIKGRLVGISFVNNMKVREDSYQTLFVNISHPKIFDFIIEIADVWIMSD